MKTKLTFIPRAAMVLLISALFVGAQTSGDRFASTPVIHPAGSGDMKPDADGFIQRWLILEPIETRGLSDSAVRAAVEKEYFPHQLSVLPEDGDAVEIDGAEHRWHAVETQDYNLNLFHFARALDKPTSNVLFWGVTVVNCPEDFQDVRLAIGSNAASVWWVNGEEVTSVYNDRQTVIDDGVSKRISLKKGSNIIRFAVINGGGATDFCARFLDQGGEPLHGYTVGLSHDGQ